MKKLFKRIALFAIVILGALHLTGCYNFYDDFSKAGAKIEKENCFKAIELNEAKAKIDAKDTFVLVLATSTNSTCVSRISLLQEQADYAEFDGVLYFVSMTNYCETATGRKELRDKLGIKGYSNNLTGSDAVIVAYTKGEITFDTSSKLTNDSIKQFVSNESINFYSLASYIFNDFNFEA
ncbi:MAG: hypothetical protein IKP12_03790 [Acholeplasmatales bacterium]|nr:hypothetical protein [Acholeplasmatales bacterium]